MIPINLLVIELALTNIETHLTQILEAGNTAYATGDHSTFDRLLENNRTAVESALFVHSKTSMMVDRLKALDNASHVVVIENTRGAICLWRELANDGHRVKAVKALKEYMNELSFGLRESISVVDLHLEFNSKVTSYVRKT